MHKLMRFIVPAVGALVLTLQMQAQTPKTVKGYVLDKDGFPLPGATVQVSNTQRIVMTDLDGAYEIQVAPNEQLVVSFMGMTPQTIKITYQRTGEPGEDTADFFIRGVTTFGTGKSNPLILIDGVEMTTTDLARLTTDDIASFSIMKDANATALYGARGANGVILVTTKEGREGSVNVQLRAEGSWSGNASEVETADPVTFMKLHNEAVRTRNPQSRLPYDEKKINYTERGIDPLYYPAIDWRDMLFKDRSFNQRYNLNVSGGGKIARYYIAANWSKDNGILKVDPRQSFNNNIDLKKS